MKILIAGGAGYIGATVASACIDAGHEPVIIDDLSTGVEAFTTGRAFVRGDIADAAVVDKVFADHPDIAATVHCAAYIVVPESVAEPLRYYDNNVAKTVAFMEHLRRNGCRRVLFSSSASVYAPAEDLSVTEQSPLAPGSPYARTKAMVEQILADAAAAGEIDAVSLRYFNPIGADPQLRTGQQLAEPSHALGRLLSSQRSGGTFTITGTDWPTRDGTGLRDYIHVWDLARAHAHAVERFDSLVDNPGHYAVLNVGTGRGTTVRELVAAFTETAGAVDVTEGPPRPGDVAGAYARVERAQAALGWAAELTVADGIRDALAWLAVRDGRVS
ncbi:MAG TPA: UDP-glucose 4-epimerase GalE [Jatrophihabitans sp.]|nr:UDP-glucose 4-epimerase GalE [Jatrophihabitans sp.]